MSARRPTLHLKFSDCLTDDTYTVVPGSPSGGPTAESVHLAISAREESMSRFSGRSFRHTFRRQATPDVMLRGILVHLVPPLASQGYHLTAQTEVSLTFTRRFRPNFALVSAAERTEEVSLVVQPDGPAECVGTVQGCAPIEVRRFFEEL
jgi:hypothetical protein